LGYYRIVLSETIERTWRFARARGIPFAVGFAGVSGVVSLVLTRELDLQALIVTLASPLVLLLLVFAWNFTRAPPRMAKGQTAIIADLQAENERLRGELVPQVSLESDNTNEYNREIEIEVFDPATHQHRIERRKVKLMKVENLSSQSVVVNAQILGVDPPITEGPGPPIMLRWKDGGRGNTTLGAHSLDYLIISPPIPNVRLWESTYFRTVRVSAWVQAQGGLGATRRFHLTNLGLENQFPWVRDLPDEEGTEEQSP